jgi:transcriptional regulator with XRE-family HTH domain
MDDVRVGRILRALRQRRGWRQADLGLAADVSQALVSLVERGELGSTPLRTLRRIAGALGAEVVVSVRWSGADVDRLLDEGHAALCASLAATLTALGWEVRPEVTFSEFGERGSIDLLCWHAGSRTLLVVEVKTGIASVEATFRSLDVKARLAAKIAREQFGWVAASVVPTLMVAGTTAARRRVARHDALFAARFPLRGAAARRWLREPRGAGEPGPAGDRGLAGERGLAGDRGLAREQGGAAPRGLLLFAPLTTPGRTRSRITARRRVGRPADATWRA